MGFLMVLWQTVEDVQELLWHGMKIIANCFPKPCTTCPCWGTLCWQLQQNHEEPHIQCRFGLRKIHRLNGLGTQRIYGEAKCSGVKPIDKEGGGVLSLLQAHSLSQSAESRNLHVYLVQLQSPPRRWCPVTCMFSSQPPDGSWSQREEIVGCAGETGVCRIRCKEVANGVLHFVERERCAWHLSVDPGWKGRILFLLLLLLDAVKI